MAEGKKAAEVKRKSKSWSEDNLTSFARVIPSNVDRGTDKSWYLDGKQHELGGHNFVYAAAILFS